MQVISLKLGSNLLQDIDSSLKKNGYSTRTEFIREAIRERLNDLEREKALKNLKKYFGAGASKKQTTEEELDRIRDKVFRKHAKKFGIKLD